MFTGIIQGKGRIYTVRSAGGGMVFGIEAAFEIDNPAEGESIAVNGVCLTAREINDRRFLADVSPESLSRTNLGKLSVGAEVNLERALRLSDRLGGHLVSGHVDAGSKVISRKTAGDFTIFNFTVPKGLGRYIVEKGSITIDGVSLTVNSCDTAAFSVSIIPHTLEVTILGALRPGDQVNLEVDIIGKYVERLLSYDDSKGQGSGNTINQAFLVRHGFVA